MKIKLILTTIILLFLLSSCSSATYICIVVDRGSVEIADGTKKVAIIVSCKELTDEEVR